MDCVDEESREALPGMSTLSTLFTPSTAPGNLATAANGEPGGGGAGKPTAGKWDCQIWPCPE